MAYRFKRAWVVEFSKKKGNQTYGWVPAAKFKSLPEKITVQVEATIISHALKRGGAKFWREHGLKQYWMSACYALPKTSN